MQRSRQPGGGAPRRLSPKPPTPNKYLHEQRKFFWRHRFKFLSYFLRYGGCGCVARVVCGSCAVGHLLAIGVVVPYVIIAVVSIVTIIIIIITIIIIIVVVVVVVAPLPRSSVTTSPQLGGWEVEKKRRDACLLTGNRPPPKLLLFLLFLLTKTAYYPHT